MMRLCLLVLMLLLAACQTAPAVNLPPTAIPFPTMTPGRLVRGILPPVAALPLDGSVRANPATAVALAVRPTATPDYSACPPLTAPALALRAAALRDDARSIEAFLSAGGSPAALETALRDEWDALGDTGLVRADVDFTGEGTPDVLVTLNGLDGGGLLLVLHCSAGRYVTSYEWANGDGPPQVIYAGDINADTRADLLFAGPVCEGDADCMLETRLITWQPAQGSFVSLLGSSIRTQELPTVSDVDNDRVLEIIERMSNPGTAETGPLRTGVTIYDWNGVSFLRSITQLDPPRFRIQVIQQGDLSASRREFPAAASLYRLALEDTNLRNWFNDDPPILTSYILYRLLTIYAFTEDERLLSIYQAILSNYPNLEEAPVYASMGTTFWDSLQQTNNLRSACQAVQAIISQRPEALDRLNRYGSRTYTASDLCPF